MTISEYQAAQQRRDDLEADRLRALIGNRSKLPGIEAEARRVTHECLRAELGL